MASSCVRVSTFLLIVLLCCYNSSGAVLPRAYTSVLSRSINPTTLAHLAPPSLPSTTTSDAAISPAASSLPSVRASIDREVPFVSRVSGCVDEADRTYECPIRTSLDLTMYGLNFQRAAVTITFTDGGTVVPCTDVRVSTDERLRCHFNTGEVRPQRREMLSVVVNSSLGSSTFDAAVDVNEKVMQPTIVEASGCMDSGTQTQDCRSSSEVRLTGAHYPRWLTPSLIISGKLSLPCQWKGEVWGVYCSLSDRRVDDLPTGQLLPVQVRFADDRISEPEYALAMYSNSPHTAPAAVQHGPAAAGGGGQ